MSKLSCTQGHVRRILRIPVFTNYIKAKIYSPILDNRYRSIEQQWLVDKFGTAARPHQQRLLQYDSIV